MRQVDIRASLWLTSLSSQPTYPLIVGEPYFSSTINSANLALEDTDLVTGDPRRKTDYLSYDSETTFHINGRMKERAEQHFGRRLVEYERNMAERTWEEVGANRAEVMSALETVAANNAQLVAQGNIAFEQRDRALRQTVREEFDSYRAHLAMEMQEDIPLTLRLALLMFVTFLEGNSTRVPARWNGMPVSTVKSLQWHCVRRRIAS